LPSDTLANASQLVYDSGFAAKQYSWGDFYFSPTVDGKIIQELPSKAFAEGHFSEIPVITDRNAYEGQFEFPCLAGTRSIS
jgi:hypothetical protein